MKLFIIQCVDLTPYLAYLLSTPIGSYSYCRVEPTFNEDIFRRIPRYGETLKPS